MSSSTDKLPEGIVTSDVVQGRHATLKLWQIAIAAVLVLLLGAGGGLYVLYIRGSHVTTAAKTQNSQPIPNDNADNPAKGLAQAQASVQAAQTDQQKAAAYQSLGTAYLNNTQPDQAVQAFQNALSAGGNVDKIPLLAELANAERTAGNKAGTVQAIQQLVQALQQSNNPEYQKEAAMYQQELQTMQGGGR